MSELDIPTTTRPTTLPSSITHGTGATVPPSQNSAALEEKAAGGGLVNGHGAGYDGQASATGHANANGNKVRCVTMAVVGAGQRGQVSTKIFERSPELYDFD